MQINQWDKPQDGIKEKNHMITSVDGETAFDKVQHPFVIKNAQQFGYRKYTLHIIKTICDH